MSKFKKSDYSVLPRKECETPKNGSNSSHLFIAINKFLICHADDVAQLHEAKDLDWLQENRQIIRMLPVEFEHLAPYKILEKDKTQAEKILSRNSKKRIIVSTELWYQFISKSEKGYSKLDIDKKIDETIENLVNKHMYVYDGQGNRSKETLFSNGIQ